MRLSIVGTGYVGLVSGACFAELGHEVVCVDIDPEKIDRINRGESPIYEKGLDEILARHAGQRLRGTTDLRAAVMDSELSIIAVGTPLDGQEIDLGQVHRTAEAIGEVLKDKPSYHVVVVKSTVVPGTTDGGVCGRLEAASGKRAGADFGLGMNPEFLTEGVAVSDFLHPDRIVLGGIDQRTLDTMNGLYASFAGVPILRTNNSTAEMIKYASNALLATLISFSNEIGNFCERLDDVDVTDVLRGVHLSRYLTTRLENGEAVTAEIAAFLGAGCGFGGSCLPKDVKALIAEGRRRGQPMELLQSVVRINESRPARILEILKQHFSELKGHRFAVLGLAFKPDTDDVRESPALPIIRALTAAGAEVRAYDPIALGKAKQLLPGGGVICAESLKAALEGVEAAVLVTSWPQFKEVPKLLRSMSPSPLLVDGRRMLDKRMIEHYVGIGLHS